MASLTWPINGESRDIDIVNAYDTIQYHSLKENIQ